MKDKKQTKILLIGHTLVLGGSEKVLANLAELLSRENYEVHVTLIRNKIECSLPANIIIHPSTIPNWLRTKWIYEKLFAKKIKKLDKIYQFKTIFSNFLTVRKWLPHAIESKTFYYLHFDYTVPYQQLKRKQINKAHKFKQKIYHYFNNRNIIAVSKGSAQFLQTSFQVTPKYLCILYNFFNFNLIKKLSYAYTPEIKMPYIIHVARFDPEIKRQDLLLDAFLKIQTNIPLILLTQPNDALNKMVSTHPKKSNIHIVPFQENPYPWIKNAKLLILCSDFEGFGNVLVEALICQTPVISTNCPSGPREILGKNMSNWLVQCNNSTALANKIDQYLSTNQYIIDQNHLEKFSDKSAIYRSRISLLDV